MEFLIRKDAIKKIGKVFNIDPKFTEEIIKNINITFLLSNSFSKFNDFIIPNPFSINEINSIIDEFLEIYRIKRNNLKNTYIQASNYFQS